jgi:hypothetical protein
MLVPDVGRQLCSGRGLFCFLLFLPGVMVAPPAAHHLLSRQHLISGRDNNAWSHVNHERSEVIA